MFTKTYRDLSWIQKRKEADQADNTLPATHSEKSSQAENNLPATQSEKSSGVRRQNQKVLAPNPLPFRHRTTALPCTRISQSSSLLQSKLKNASDGFGFILFTAGINKQVGAPSHRRGNGGYTGPLHSRPGSVSLSAVASEQSGTHHLRAYFIYLEFRAGIEGGRGQAMLPRGMQHNMATTERITKHV